ncbi:MAG: hypothetical protein LBC90_09310, partial [Candidatus Adiutrix sp.]|nr:hypothetical protein [Candidatus Adiutrix sp.]
QKVNAFGLHKTQKIRVFQRILLKNLLLGQIIPNYTYYQGYINISYRAKRSRMGQSPRIPACPPHPEMLKFSNIKEAI